MSHNALGRPSFREINELLYVIKENKIKLNYFKN